MKTNNRCLGSGTHTAMPNIPHTQSTTLHGCSGDGSCLTQTTNCNTYGRNPEFTCVRNCEPMKCPNFQVCGTYAPEWYFRCHHGRCQPCNMKFGKNLVFPEEPQECPICFDTGPSVIQPNCTHSVCIDCFKRTRVDGPPRTGEPQFPYPDREDEYFDHDPFQPPHPLENDPLVVRYHAAWERWDNEWNANYNAEQHLRRCPMCRG